MLSIVFAGTVAALALGKGHGGGQKGGGEKQGGRRTAQRQQQPQREMQRPQQQRVQHEQRQQPQRTQREQRQPPQWEQSRRQDVVRNEQRRVDPRLTAGNGTFGQRPIRSDRGPAIGQGNRDTRGQRPIIDNSQATGRQRQDRLNNASPNNYGYERSNEVHDRNAQRKMWKNEERSFRSDRNYNASNAGNYQNGPYYADNGYNYQYPEHRRVGALRFLIASTLGINAGYNYNYYPQYQPAYYDDRYYSANYYGYSQYHTYGPAPYFADYRSYGYGYDSQYADDPGYQDNSYSGISFSLNFGNMQYGDYGLRSSSRYVAAGYDEGYYAGLNARNAGYGDRYYSDPYDNEEANYVPYMNSMSQNRHCLSDGYGLGYDDALYEQPGSEQYLSGNVDLITIFVSGGLRIG